MRELHIETLEPRTLLAGVTILDTGRLGNNTGWMATMATAITNQLGGPSQVPQYTLLIGADPNTGALVASYSHASGTATPQTSDSGEILLLVNYFSISANASYSSTAIGQVIANFLLTAPVDGVTLASLPIHEIGLSRGAPLFDQANLFLGQAGVWVSQETYLDPDPIAVQGDPPDVLYDNVEFADNYWRNDGSTSQANDGDPVTGAYNLNIPWLDSESQGWPLVHVAVAGYYIGTIDPTVTQTGDGPINPQWYGNTSAMPAANQTGWIYSDLVGAPRPLAGVWAASGGTGTRTAAGQSGAQWGNVSDLALTSASTFASGTPLSASFIHQDRDSADTVSFFLDTDRNPYNGAFAATLGSTNFAQTNTTAIGTATLSTVGVAPGTYWLCAKVTDAPGNTRYTYEAITAPLKVTALVNPIAALASPATIAAAGSAAESLIVTYIGSAPINVASFDNSDLTVSGPGLSGAVQYVGVDGNTGSNTRVVTYSLAAPAGGWVAADNGSYSVSIQANQVNDTSGRFVAAGAIGSFSVNIGAPSAGTLSGSQNKAASSYNLTTLGTSDWAHWGRANNFANFDHKATGGSQISTATKLGSGSYGSYFDSTRQVIWSDGTPTGSSSGDNAYIWANTALGAGYSFTVPADTTVRTLLVYAGGFSSGDTLTAHLSDGSAADYVATASGTGIYTNLYTITYSAASAGQKLTISYVKSSNIAGTGGSVDLIAATLSGAAATPPPTDTTRPTAVVTSAVPITIATNSAYTFSVTYSDNVAINAVTIGNNNLVVTASGYNQPATLISSGLTNGATVVATYSVPAPAGGWGNANNGTYTIGLLANQIADTSGNFALGVSSLGTFAVNIPGTVVPSGPLSDADIGAPAIAGSASLNTATSVWTLSGSGGDIWNNSDQFNFASASVSGDSTLVAEVTSLTNTDVWAKAGLMFRDGLAANAANVAVLATPGNGVTFQWRVSAGGGSNYTNIGNIPVPTAAAPLWLKLVRAGNGFSGYYSTNGTNYTLVGSQTIPMSTSLLAGPAITSHNNGSLGTATFANVAVPSGGVSTPVPLATPSITATPGTNAVSLSWSTIAGATSYNLYRSTTSGGEGTTPYVSGITGLGYVDNSVTAGTTYYYKLSAVNSSTQSSQSTESSATPTASIPSGTLSDADIGSPEIAGSASFNSTSGTWTVSGGGSDIWNNSDQFNFASTAANGDTTLTAEVTSFTNTDVWAKAGLMFRAGSAANAANVAVLATPGNGVTFQYRTSAGGGSNYNNIGNILSPSAAAPVWLKLVRAGNVFTAYYSTNGTTYTQVGTQTITLSTSLLAGLAVTSHNNGVLGTATFANVNV
jgi:hypothetical protein